MLQNTSQDVLWTLKDVWHRLGRGWIRHKAGGSMFSYDLYLNLTKPDKFTICFLWCSVLLKVPRGSDLLLSPETISFVSIISPPAGGARGGRYKFKVTKSKKNRPCCGFFSNLYTKLIKQNVNMVKTTSQRRDGTKKTRKCIYWWKILPSFGGSARVTFRQIQKLGTRIIKYRVKKRVLTSPKCEFLSSNTDKETDLSEEEQTTK